MSKSKKASIENNRKERTFFYEILGIVALLVAFVAFARFGIIGKYTMLTFRFLFGDWYFVFIILLGVFGIYCLLVHQSIEIKSIRYYGIVLILLALLVLTHFSMHNFVNNYEGNSFLLTVNLYLDYFKTYRPEMMVGGGIIGATFFYIFYYLLSAVGTVIISCILLFIGVVFLSKKTIKDFMLMIGKGFKKIGLIIKHQGQKIVKNVNQISKEYGNSDNKKNRRIKKMISPLSPTNEKLQIQRSEEIVTIIKDAFRHLEINIENVSYLICHHIVVFFVRTKQDINFKVLEHTLLRVLKEKFMIKYDQYNEQIVIEVNKIKPTSLSFSEAFNELDKNQFMPIIGMDDRNILVELDGNALIICENETLLATYFISLFTFCTIQKKCESDLINVVDLNNCLKQYCFHNIPFFSDRNKLVEIVREIDETLETLNLHHKRDVDEYNLNYPDKIKKKMYFIYGIEEIIYEKGYFENLLYIVQTGKMAGITVVLSLMSNAFVSTVLLSGIDYKIILKNQFEITNKLINSEYFNLISPEVEGFLKYRDLILRISLLLMTQEELEKYYPFHDINQKTG